MDTHEGNRSIYRWQYQVLLFVIALLLTACGDEPPPTMTAIPTAVPLLPTAPPTTTLSLPSTTPLTVSGTLVLPLSTAVTSMTIESPLTISVGMPMTQSGLITAAAIALAGNVMSHTNTAHQSITTTITSTTPTSTIPAVQSTEPCTIENDVALLSYPDISAYLGCGLAEASFDPVAINEFGPGPEYNRFMLWFGSENQIYVLLPDKQWQVYPDTWTEEQATYTCNPLEGEAASPPLPRRGFGKIWCTVDGLQATMGTIEREERLCQHTVTQLFDRGRLLACYEDATIRFFRIMDDGTWDQMLTQ